MIESMASELGALLRDLPGIPSLPEDDINFWPEDMKSFFPEWEPWFSLLPVGRDAELYQLGLFVRAYLVEGDPMEADLSLGTIVDDELLFYRDGSLRGVGDFIFLFDVQNPLGFFPIQALRWMRFSLSIFDMDMSQQFWRTRPGEYFGVQVPVEHDPIFNEL